MPKNIFGEEIRDDTRRLVDATRKTRIVLANHPEAASDPNLLIGLVWLEQDGFDKEARRIAEIVNDGERRQAWLDLLKNTLTPAETITRMKRKYE